MLLGNGCGVEVTRDAARLLRILEEKGYARHEKQGRERREKGAMEVKEEGKARPSGVTAGICCLRGLGKNSSSPPRQGTCIYSTHYHYFTFSFSYLKRFLFAILTSLWSMSMPTILRGLKCRAMARVRNEHACSKCMATADNCIHTIG